MTLRLAKLSIIMLLGLTGCVGMVKTTALEIVALPTKIVYTIGVDQTLDLSGGTIRVETSDKKTQILSMNETQNSEAVFAVSESIDFTVEGTYPVTLTKDGISVSFDVTVQWPPYIDDNPIVIRLYNDATRVQLTEVSGAFVKNVDIGVYSVFFTDLPKIPKGYFQNVFTQYYDQYTDIDTYKIGYYLSFKLKSGETMEKLILGPKDDPDFMWDYVRVYLYDDVHQPIGHWYRHLLESEVTDETLMTSIKLTGNSKTTEIDGPITLIAFTFDGPEDFDPITGLYRGQSSATLTITAQ